MYNKWAIPIFHILFWGITAWLIISSFSITAHEIEVVDGREFVSIVRSDGLAWQLVITLLLSAFIFYANLRILNQLSNQTQTAIKSSILLTLGLLTAMALNYNVPAGLGPQLPLSLVVSIIIFYFAVSVAVGIGRAWIRSETQKHQIALEKKQVELNQLRAHLQPHFLFNVLNNLLSMVDQKQNPKLGSSITRLSGLLRYVVDETRHHSVPVAKEIAFIEDYADLQLLRFEPDEVKFELEVKGDQLQLPVEPGIFLPFVENAFQHGTEPEQQAELYACFDLRADNTIRFTIQNTLPPTLTPRQGAKTGLAATRRRLQLAYPERHRLQITSNNQFIVELEINVHESDYR